MWRSFVFRVFVILSLSYVCVFLFRCSFSSSFVEFDEMLKWNPFAEVSCIIYMVHLLLWQINIVKQRQMLAVKTIYTTTKCWHIFHNTYFSCIVYKSSCENKSSRFSSILFYFKHWLNVACMQNSKMRVKQVSSRWNVFSLDNVAHSCLGYN